MCIMKQTYITDVEMTLEHMNQMTRVMKSTLSTKRKMAQIYYIALTCLQNEAFLPKFSLKIVMGFPDKMLLKTGLFLEMDYS